MSAPRSFSAKLRAMTEREAAQELAESELVKIAQGAMSYIKELQGKCLDSDIPVALARCEGTS